MVGFPLLLIPLAIYNIIVFLMPDVSFTDPLVKLTLMSGAEWTVTLSDVLLTLAILLLLAEVIKGARPGAKYLTDHLLSLIVFGAAAAEFVLWPKFGTSTYFLLTALALVDFLSGLALGAILGAVGFVRITVWSAFSPMYGEHWLLIAWTVALSLVMVVLWGSLIGSLLPLLLRRVGFDPATSSAPFVATLVDVTGLVIYFTVASVVLRGTML